ncbi:FAD-dependent oxidoreductase [Patescibacteria group bacterium]
MKNKKYIKIAVVGGGIFGVTAAIKLAEEGYVVDLFERNDDILKAASGINQFRSHRGYHYPRSGDTIKSCIHAAPRFEEEYKDAIIKSFNHYYCIAKEKSFTTKEDFLSVCKEYDLDATECKLDAVNYNTVDLCINADENIINHKKLKEICNERLQKNNVNVFFNTEVNTEKLNDYDFVVVATYANQNKMIKELTGVNMQYQYELCEKPVVRMPKHFEDISIVVMDGPFTCIDPFGDTGLFLMGHVEHAIHKREVGEEMNVPPEFIPLLNNGIIENPPITNFELFKESAKDFIPAIAEAEHVGSMFTIRTVLPNLDDTDSRPTIVNSIDDRVISIFSGKIGNCVNAAEEVVDIVNRSTKN